MNTSVHAQKVIKRTIDESGFEKQLTEIDLMHQTAAQLMSAEQWTEATAELEKVVHLEADRLEAWQDLAKCYSNLKEYEKAAAAYESAHKLQPESTDLLSNLGYAQLHAENWDAAVEAYEKMIVLDDMNYDANVHLGFIHQKNGDTEDAILHYEKALAGKADDVQTMGSLAKLYVETDDQVKADEMYTRAIESASPEQAKELRGRLGKSLIDAKKYDEAAVVYAALVESDPDNASNQFNLGISLMQGKRKADAVPHLKKVIELRPDYGQAYQYLAQCYNGSGNYSAAVTTLRKGVTVSDSPAGMYYTWGQSYEKMQMYDEAIEMFEKITGDATYGGHAKKQIQRQLDLIKRDKMANG